MQDLHAPGRSCHDHPLDPFLDWMVIPVKWTHAGPEEGVTCGGGFGVGGAGGVRRHQGQPGSQQRTTQDAEDVENATPTKAAEQQR